MSMPRTATRPDGPAGDPRWLAAWRDGPFDRGAALARFDGLPSVAPGDLIGEWRGTGLPSGHPLDGLLEDLGWYGKRFETEDDVHALLFGSPAGGIVSLDPARLPVSVALAWPRLARTSAVRVAFSTLRPVLAVRRPTALLRRTTFRGVSSAAMIYRRQPIVDHFRRIDAIRVLGLMEMRGTPPYFFLLRSA